MIVCPECGGEMTARANPLFRSCADCGKLMVVTEEARKLLEEDPSRTNRVPAPNGLEVEEALTGDIVVPDFTDVMIGWRAWKVELESGFPAKLLSMNDEPWPQFEPMVAECGNRKAAVTSGLKPRAEHEIPNMKCSCGIYSAKSRAHLLSMRYHHYDPDNPRVVIGSINLWGRIVEGTQGWRAAVGYPREIYVPHLAWKLAEPLADAYGVPVKLANTLLVKSRYEIEQEAI
jgi:hypothetical protein